MMSLRSSLWAPTPSGPEDRRSSAGMPGQPLPKYSPIVKCLPGTRPSLLSTQSRSKSPRPLQSNAVILSSRSSLRAAYLHHPARRRCSKGPSGLAHSKRVNTSRPRMTTATSPQTRQSEHQPPSNAQKSFFLPATQPITIMARKTPAGRKPRGGRLLVKLPDEVQIGSNSTTQRHPEAQPDNGPNLTSASNLVETSELESQHQTEDGCAPNAILCSINSGLATDKPTAAPATPASSTPPSPTINPRELITNPTRALNRRANSLQEKKDNQLKKAPLSPTSLVASGPPTPENHIDETTEKSSELSSLPASIDNLPKETVFHKRRQAVNSIQTGSPVRRSTRTRQQMAKLADTEAIDSSFDSDASYLDIPRASKRKRTRNVSQTPREVKRPRVDTIEALPLVDSTSIRKAEITKSDRKNATMHGSDAQIHQSSTNSDAPRRGGRNNGRGGARATRGGPGNGKGRGGKHRGSGRGKDEDSPEPQQPRRTQNQEETLLIKHAKARQAELRRMFTIIANQQAEVLDIMASRDLTRIAKKPKAHRQVPEYDEVVEDLEEMEKMAREVALRQYAVAVEAENDRFAAEKEAIENRFKTKKADLNEECQKGAQGDLIIFQRAVAAAHDETRTQDGSEADYFPRYHDFPEPDQSIRGYALSRITDEKPFKHHLRTYDDEATREVIDDDVRPIIQAFARKNAERRAEEERKRTQTIEALSAVADKELEEIKGHVTPKPTWQQEDVNSFALSCLADVADWVAQQQQYQQKHYTYPPHESGNQYPREALTYEPSPGKNAHIHRASYPESKPEFDNMARPLSPDSSIQGSRRSLRNLQPNAPFTQPPLQIQPPPSTAPSNIQPTSAVSATPGPTLAPAPPKIAPAPSQQQSQPPRPPPIDTRLHNPAPAEQSPVQPLQNQSATQPPQGLPPLQPRHMSQSSLPPPPPGYTYPPSYSPTHPPAGYPAHHGAPSPYQPIPPPSPYHHHQHPLPPPPSPYSQHPQTPYHQYGPSPYYPPPPALPPQQQQQQFSFMPPQQGPAPPQSSPAARPHSRARSVATTLPPPPLQDHYQNGYHSRTHSHTFQAHHIPATQVQPPPHTTITAKSRTRAKQKQPVTFVNQTLATRKAAAEQLAKEEAAAALEKREREKGKDKKGNSNDKGRKLAPKVESV